jgi:hypothetical protein
MGEQYISQKKEEQTEKLNYISENTESKMGGKARRDTMLESHKTMSVPRLLYKSKNWLVQERDKTDFKQVKRGFRSLVGNKAETKRSHGVRGKYS